jgi:antitoxin VapB
MYLPKCAAYPHPDPHDLRLSEAPNGLPKNCRETAPAPLPCLYGKRRQEYYIKAYTFIDNVMALSIKDPEADRLARAVAKATGETLTTAVVQSLRERLARVRRARGPRLSEEILKIARRCARLPLNDKRSADEIIGYDEHGLPR